MRPLLIMILLDLFLFSQCQPNKPGLRSLKEDILSVFPRATINSLEYDEPYSQGFKIGIPQYLDHTNPYAGTFTQYFYLYHIGYNVPVHLETGGYSAYLKPREISQKLGLNLIIVEYRFYGESKPESIPWEYLTNDQAIGDYHRINQAFRKIYKEGKWLISGVSKGGETAMIYKSKYPEDADVVIPYVAPIILDTMDMRPWQHIQAIGTEKCRNKVLAFQRSVLLQKDKMLELLSSKASKDSLSFSIGNEVALEFAVLEYPFMFWQWNGDCENIPAADTQTSVLFNYLDAKVGYSTFADQNLEGGYASYYQHMKELGYYTLDTTGLSKWLSTSHYSYRTFAPKGVDLLYNSGYMTQVKKYMENEAEKVIWIYGGLDPWGACTVNPKGKNTMKFIKPDGTHRTRIIDLDSIQQIQIYDSLRSWLEVDNTKEDSHF